MVVQENFLNPVANIFSALLFPEDLRQMHLILLLEVPSELVIILLLCCLTLGLDSLIYLYILLFLLILFLSPSN